MSHSFILRFAPSKPHCTFGAIFSFAIMWICTGFFFSEAVLASAVTALPNATKHTVVIGDKLLVPMPIYISSIIATAVFTWTISLWNQKRDKKMDEMENMIKLLKTELEKHSAA